MPCTKRDLTASTVLVTGANRGLGRSLVDALVARGVPKVYAAARDPRGVLSHPAVVAVPLDLTDQPSITALAEQATDVDVLINNAGAAEFAPVLDATPDAVARELAVNHTAAFAALGN